MNESNVIFVGWSLWDQVRPTKAQVICAYLIDIDIGMKA
jgi:hypothetical protein